MTQMIARSLWMITGGAISALIASSIQRAQARAEQQDDAPPAPRQPVTASAAPSPAILTNTSGLSWRKQMYVYTGLLLIGYSIWLLDGVFTVIGVINMVSPRALPLLLVTAGAAIAGHLFISWGQHTLIFHPDRTIKAIGITLLGINTLSNVYGLTTTVRLLRPPMLGSLPADPAVWLTHIATWMGSHITRTFDQRAPIVPTPPWLLTMIAVILLALVLAWFAEKIRDYFRTQWDAMRALRPR